MSKVICFDHDLSKGLNEFQPSTYEFICPDFGESNTDQSYYEPTASAIANMNRAASSDIVGSFDYDTPLPKGSDGKVDIKKATKQLDSEITKASKVATLRSKGSTFEELSQLETDTINDVSETIEKEQKRQKSKQDQIIDAISMANAVEKSRNGDNGNSE